MRGMVAGVVLFAVGASPAVALQVERAVACTEVEAREPVGVAEGFPADVGAVLLFTRLTGIEAVTTITHVWYHGDREVARIPLGVRPPAWRTWSEKRIYPGMTGAWRVVVEDAEGRALREATFTIHE